MVMDKVRPPIADRDGRPEKLTKKPATCKRLRARCQLCCGHPENHHAVCRGANDYHVAAARGRGLDGTDHGIASRNHEAASVEVRVVDLDLRLVRCREEEVRAAGWAGGWNAGVL